MAAALHPGPVTARCSGQAAVSAYNRRPAARHSLCLAAFASFLGALVVTLPSILIAEVIALAGLWVINNVNLSSLPSLTVFERSDTGSSNDSGNRPSRQTTGQGGDETTGSRQ
jgi:hypothetical protein